MQTHVLKLSIAAMALLGITAQGSTLSFSPSAQFIASGASTSVDIVVSGLGDPSSPSLGAFDIDITFDSSILSASSLSFGSHLDLGGLGSIQFSNLATPGTVHLDEVSLELPTALNAGQPNSFILATIHFTGSSVGLSPLAFQHASLSDENGASLLDVITGSGSITVRAANAVPDASSTTSMMMSAVGLLGWYGSRPRGRKTLV